MVALPGPARAAGGCALVAWRARAHTPVRIGVCCIVGRRPGDRPEAQKKRGGLRLPRCLVAPASASVFQIGAECVQDLVNLLDILGDLIYLSKFETLDQPAPIIGKIYRGLPFL